MTKEQVASKIQSYLPNLNVSLDYDAGEGGVRLDYNGDYFNLYIRLCGSQLPATVETVIPIDYTTHQSYLNIARILPTAVDAVPNPSDPVIDTHSIFACELGDGPSQSLVSSPIHNDITVKITRARLYCNISYDGSDWTLDDICVVAEHTQREGTTAVAKTYAFADYGDIASVNVSDVAPGRYKVSRLTSHNLFLVPEGYCQDIGGICLLNRPLVQEGYDEVAVADGVMTSIGMLVTGISNEPGIGVLQLEQNYIMTRDFSVVPVNQSASLDPTKFSFDWDAEHECVRLIFQEDGTTLGYIDDLPMTQTLQDRLQQGGGVDPDFEKRLIIRTPANQSITNRPCRELIKEGTIGGEFIEQFNL